jgi:hypothetical protein
VATDFVTIKISAPDLEPILAAIFEQILIDLCTRIRAGAPD